MELLIRRFVPFVPPGQLLALDPVAMGVSLLATLSLATAAGLYPAARAAIVRPAQVLRRAA